jgi:hypothetical protein
LENKTGPSRVRKRGFEYEYANSVILSMTYNLIIQVPVAVCWSNVSEVKSLGAAIVEAAMQSRTAKATILLSNMIV